MKAVSYFGNVQIDPHNYKINSVTVDKIVNESFDMQSRMKQIEEAQ